MSNIEEQILKNQIIIMQALDRTILDSCTVERSLKRNIFETEEILRND